MKERIKECPFCAEGLHPTVEKICFENYYVNLYSYYVECPSCGAQTREFATKEEAVAAWNKRKEE